MAAKLVLVNVLGHTRRRALLLKGVTVQSEKILRAAIFLAKLRDTSPNAHAIRLRYAKKISTIVETFIEEEAHRAASKSSSDQSHLTWTQIGNALEMTKSMAHRKYGEKHEH